MDVVLIKDCGLEGLTFKKPSLCKPQFAADCDLSTIIQRFLKTGQLPASSGRKPLEGDFTDVESFDEIQQKVVETKQAFEMLPLEVRNKFNNDPVAWFEHSLKASAETPEETPVEAPDEAPPSNTPPSNTPPSNTPPSNTPPSNE